MVRSLDTQAGPALLVLTFNGAGRLVDFTANRGPAHRETPEEAHAALLVQGLAQKFRRTPDLAELIRRARAALALLEDLQALQELHGAEAIAEIAAAKAAGR